MEKVYTFYQTDKRNPLGGFMTYGTLAEAWQAVVKEKKGTLIKAVTYIDTTNRHCGHLQEVLSSGVIYRA